MILSMVSVRLTVPEQTVEFWWCLSNCLQSETGQAAHYVTVALKCSHTSSQDGGGQMEVVKCYCR